MTLFVRSRYFHRLLGHYRVARSYSTRRRAARIAFLLA